MAEKKEAHKNSNILWFWRMRTHYPRCVPCVIVVVVVAVVVGGNICMATTSVGPRVVDPLTALVLDRLGLDWLRLYGLQDWLGEPDWLIATLSFSCRLKLRKVSLTLPRGLPPLPPSFPSFCPPLWAWPELLEPSEPPPSSSVSRSRRRAARVAAYSSARLVIRRTVTVGLYSLGGCGCCPGPPGPSR